MKYLVLFKGINVGRKNIVKMAELREMLSSLGFQNVTTYIQSGNALFDSNDSLDEITKKIETSFQNTFGFKSELLLRTKDEIGTVITELPFSKTEIDEAMALDPTVQHLYYYFTDSMSSHSVIHTLDSSTDSLDKIVVGKGGIYLLCYRSIRDSKLTSLLTKQNIVTTARNWNTLNKLFNMM